MAYERRRRRRSYSEFRRELVLPAAAMSSGVPPKSFAYSPSPSVAPVKALALPVALLSPSDVLLSPSDVLLSPPGRSASVLGSGRRVHLELIAAVCPLSLSAS